MNRISSIQKKLLFAFFTMPWALCLAAQDAAKNTVKTVSSGSNQLAILLAVVTVILAFVIWGMGRVLVELGRQVVEKNRQAPKPAGLVLLIGFLLLSHIGSAQNTGTAPAVNVTPNYGGLSETSFEIFITVIGMELVTILFLAFSIKRIYEELIPQKEKLPAKSSSFSNWWSGLDKKIFTRAIPVEKEADVMLDHNYDGIRELDNALPPWWKYGFYFTIGVAFIYLLNFHVLGLGKNPDEEYAAEMDKARIEKEIYDANNKDKIDEKNVPMADAAGIKAGQEMFDANCVACHLKGGAGSVGPNLTDNYWLHGGSLNDIFRTIKNGYPDKGMQSWITKFNPKEISLLASYIRSIRGTNPPNAKLPQGDLYVEAAPAADSAKTIKADSAKTVKTEMAPALNKK